MMIHHVLWLLYIQTAAIQTNMLSIYMSIYYPLRDSQAALPQPSQEVFSLTVAVTVPEFKR